MFQIVKRTMRNIFRRLGFDIVRFTGEYPLDFDDTTIELCRYVQPYTMTNKERIFVLRKSVEYIIDHDIPGDIVECGVWKGGSMMAVARTLMAKHVNNRRLYLFDTFEGMSEPTGHDRNILGELAADRMNGGSGFGIYGDLLDEVRRNMRDTGYNEDNVFLVKGKVEDTLPAHAPDQISLLRLDTDWFESTYHELTHLYSRLSVGGVLIIDDYGHWEGATKAVDQYIAERGLRLLLNRIGPGGCVCVKLDP